MSGMSSATPRAGDLIEFRAFPAVTREQLKQYAEASGDFNPIHQDEEVARKMGLPGIIAHGMLTAAMIAERAIEFAQDEGRVVEGKLIAFQSRFKSMTFLGDVISIGGTVKAVKDEEIVLDLQARNQKGEITTTGEARFSLR